MTKLLFFPSSSLPILSTCAFILLSLTITTSHAFLDRSNQTGSKGAVHGSGEIIDAEDYQPDVDDEELPGGAVENVFIEEATFSDPSKNTSVDCQCGIKNPGVENGIDISDRSRQSRNLADFKPLIITIPGLNHEAAEREYPWLAAITRIKYGNRKHVVCGASLINSRFVVTAAHCINRQHISRMEINFNVHNTTTISKDQGIETRKVKSYIIHPRWNQETVDNDIGLLELDSPIDFQTSSIRPICLPLNYSHSDFDGLNATVAGWGYTQPNGPNSKVLNKVEVPIYSEKECIEETIYKDKILPSMLCAGYPEGGRDACTNDSGGPLTIEQDGKTILVGIVSWGHGCAKAQAPGVYARVTRYVDWIAKEISRGEWCNA